MFHLDRYGTHFGEFAHRFDNGQGAGLNNFSIDGWTVKRCLVPAKQLGHLGFTEIGEEAQSQMADDSVVAPMKDRASAQIAFDLAEGIFDACLSG